MNIAVITSWYDVGHSNGCFFLKSYVERNDINQCRYVWSIPKNEFFKRLKASRFNPWRINPLTRDIPFPIVVTPREFEHAIVVPDPSSIKAHRYIHEPVFHLTCPMQRLIGSTLKSNPICGAIIESSCMVPPTNRSLLIVPDHDLFTSNPNTLFTHSVLPLNWHLQPNIIMSYNLFCSYWQHLVYQPWDAVVLDRIPLQRHPQLFFTGASSIWIVSHEEIGDILSELIYIYQLDYDPEYGLGHLLHMLAEFKCLRFKKKSTYVTIKALLPPLVATINGPITPEIVEQVLIPMESGVYESPTAIQLRIAQLRGFPMPPLHYMDMAKSNDHVPPDYSCQLCQGPIQSPTRNYCCNHYFCYSCLNNHCIVDLDCPTCVPLNPFYHTFFRGDDHDSQIRFRHIESERHFLPEGDVSVILKELASHNSRRMIFFSNSIDHILEPLHQALLELNIAHRLVLDTCENPCVDPLCRLLLVPTHLIPNFKDKSITHLLGARINPQDETIWKHNFPKTKITLLK